MKKCPICGAKIQGMGNNAYPLFEGICCDKCNSEKVIPFRLLISQFNKDDLIVITTGNTIYKKDLKEGNLSLKETQELVGGYIEVYPYENELYYVFIDEDGLLKNGDFNPLAKRYLDIDVVGTVVLYPKEYIK